MSTYDVREYRPGDEISILETFNHVFGEHDPAFRRRTMEEWQWAFPRNPAGFRIFVAEHEGAVVAQAAGQPYRVSVDGVERVFVNGVDSMTHPDHRRGLKRPGLFVKVATAFHEAYEGDDRDWLHYGLPIEQAARMGERFLGYRLIRDQPILWQPVEDGPRELPPDVVVIDRFDDRVRPLYDRCSGAWGASTIRDAAFLNWRFLDHPTRDYVALGVFGEAGTLRGMAVYRHGRLLHDNIGFFVDWLAPSDDAEVGELLRRALTVRARADGAQAVGGIVPEWSDWHRRLLDEGWRVLPTDYCLRCRPTHPAMSTEWLRDHWWYQLADTDLL